MLNTSTEKERFKFLPCISNISVSLSVAHHSRSTKRTLFEVFLIEIAKKVHRNCVGLLFRLTFLHRSFSFSRCERSITEETWASDNSKWH